MTPLAVIQSGANDAAHATLWVVLVALTGLVASFASVWRSFVIPKEYATRRDVKALEDSFEKHLDHHREDDKIHAAKLEAIQNALAGIRVDIAHLRAEVANKG